MEIGKTTEAERTRLHGELHSRLMALGRAFNEELTSACSSRSADAERWFRRAALAEGVGGTLRLQSLDRRTGRLSPMEWPAEWSATRESLSERLRGDGMGPAPMRDSALVVLPRFARRPENRLLTRAAQKAGPEPGWVLLELDVNYVRGTVLPGLLHRYLGVGGKLDYDAESVENGARGNGQADDSIALLDIRPDGAPGPRPGRGFGGFEHDGPPPPPDGGHGRWRLFVRHSTGSLEALVEQTRRRNLTISAGILLLILAAVAAVARFARRAQQLAQLQMDFVAGSRTNCERR